MSDKKKQVLESLKEMVSHMSDLELDSFLTFWEGYALKANQQQAQTSQQNSA